MPKLPDGTPGRGQKKKWKKIALIAAGIVVTVPVLMYALGIWELIPFSGGIRSVFIKMIPMPNPASRGVTTKRNATKRDMEAAFNALEPTTQLTYFATSSFDECYRGENNWKIKEGYAHRCDLRVTRYYGFNSDFRLTMLDLDQKLASQNWQPIVGWSPSRVIREYYDAYQSESEDQKNEDKKNFGGSYLVSDLPEASLQKDSIEMEISYLERASKDKADGKGLRKLMVAQQGIEWAHGNTTIYQNKKFVNVDSLFAKITESNGFVLTITMQKNYFEN